jgi:[acyl-carrier-protein] S-malonyltransferase
MMPAQVRLAGDLSTLDYEDVTFPVFHNVDAAANSDPSAVAAKLTEQVSSPVRWLQTIENMSAAGVEKFVEVGPGKVLTGLVRQIKKDAVCANVENAKSLRITLELQ